MADPGVVTDADRGGGAPIEEALVVFLALEIPARAVGEVVHEARPSGACGIDADMRGDVGELADGRIGDLGVLDAVGIIAEGRVGDAAAAPISVYMPSTLSSTRAVG